MSKYSFLKKLDKKNRFDTTRVQIDVETDSLEDLLEAFEDFLRGCGFSAPIGSLQIIEEKDGDESKESPTDVEAPDVEV